MRCITPPCTTLTGAHDVGSQQPDGPALVLVVSRGNSLGVSSLVDITIVATSNLQTTRRGKDGFYRLWCMMSWQIVAIK